LLLTLVQYLIWVGAGVPLAYYLAATICAWLFFRRQLEVISDFSPPVTIMKPMRGLDRQTYQNIASFCQQDYPQYEVLFGVDDDHDPVIPVIQELMRGFPGLPIRLVIGGETSGSNNKVTKLCRLVREASHDILVVSDSDIRVEPDYLRRVTFPFCDAHIGAVTCLYRGMTEPNLWSELEDLNLTSDFHGGVLVARKLGVKFALGATMAVRRAALAEMGGFEVLADSAADDHELGNQISARGYGVELAHCVVQTECSSRSFLDFFQHHLRWAIVTRQSEPWGHFASILGQGLPWLIVVASVIPSRMIVAGYAITCLALRFAMAFTVGGWGLQDPLLRRKWWLVPLRDALGFLVWLASLFLNQIRWQGSLYYIRKGRLIRADLSPMGNNKS
jgi:ceramide glucosyltransferase